MQKLSLVLLSLAALLAGCEDKPKIRTYNTEKPADVHAGNHVDGETAADAPAMPPMMQNRPAAGTSAPAGEPVRMFAAIVPQGEQTWFYKVTGPVELVGKKATELGDFVKNVKYADGQPEWTLPEGWSREAGNTFRFATLKVPVEGADEPLEMSVSALPGGAPETEQAVANINRWRGQVGLGDIDAKAIEAASDDLSQETSRVKSGESTIYFVNLVGKQQAGGMMPPFAR